jgi:phosphoglycolate phosphatase
MQSHLVFDLDGTISDPATGAARSINHALSSFGYAEISVESVSRYIGPPIDEVFAYLTGSASRAEITALIAKYRERYAEIGYTENVIYPGIVAAIETLSARAVPLGVCTTKRADFAGQILSLFGIREHFRFVSGGEVGITKEAQLKALLADGTIDARSLMIGDRAVDVQAAHANGLRSVAVLWGHGSRTELAAAGPSLLLESPEQLVELANALS